MTLSDRIKDHLDERQNITLHLLIEAPKAAQRLYDKYGKGHPAAHAVGISQGHLSQIMNGVKPCTPELYLKIERAAK